LEDYPKVIWETPPGGAWRRVLDRSVITLPQFWLLPFENLLLEVPLRLLA
jgi:hypothetical protein